MGVDAQMFVKLQRDVPLKELKTLRWEMGEAFGAEHFFIDREGKYTKPPRHAIERIRKYEQDGDPIKPKAGETFLEVHVWGRYYGVGYERGDAPFLIALADWLEKRTSGEVWYGGDSSGICAIHFDAVERAALWAHFVKFGHLPYRDDPRVGDRRTSFIAPHEQKIERHCEFCDMPMARNGWGQSYAGFDCYGCGARETTQDNGATWQVEAKG